MEKQSVRGAMCKLAEDVIAHRAESNDASLIEAIIPDPHSDCVSVPASYLASLPEIVSFVPALDAAHREKFLVTVLTEFSEHLKANKDKEGKFVIHTEYRRNPQNTLIMHNVPADAKENDLREVFLSIPTAASVSFKKDINSCWLATFDTEANCVATHSALFGQKIIVKGATISIGLRATRFVHVTPSSAAPASSGAATTAQQATTVPAGSYNGMRAGIPANMRQQQYFPQQYFMWMPQQQYYQAMSQARVGGQHQAGWSQQQKQRNGRGNGHSRYQNPAYQQQRAAPEQMAVSGASGAAPAAAATTASTAAPAPAANASATTTAAAPAQTTAPQQQQQQREGQRGGRGGRNRRYGRGGNRNHGNQNSAAGSETNPAGSAPKEHRSRQPAATSTATERQEQPSKPQKKPTADSFPPLA